MGVRGWSPRTPVFASPVPAHLADAGLIRPSPGGWERNMFLSEILWGFQPHTLSYFLLVQKVTNTHPGHLNTHRGGTISMGSLPYVPLPHDDTKGASPLWNPPSQSCGLSGDPSRFDLRGWNESRLTPRFSPLAKTLVRRTPGENPNETCAPLRGRLAEYRR